MAIEGKPDIIRVSNRDFSQYPALSDTLGDDQEMGTGIACHKTVIQAAGLVCMLGFYSVINHIVLFP